MEVIMKQIPRKLTALFLSAALAASALALPAGASFALGDDLAQQDALLSHATTLSTNVFWSSSQSDLRRENLITYTPGPEVTPIITYGETLGSRVTTANAAAALEAQGYRVVAGINGDFFEPSGQPIGLVIRDGQFLSSDNGYYAIGFRADGTAILGKPGISATADLGYQIYDEAGNGTQAVANLAGVNKPRASTGGIYLYTYDFNAKHTTGTTQPGVDVICTIEDGFLTVGGTMILRVERVVTDASATAILPGQVVLTVNNSGDPYFVSALSGVPEGGIITVSATAADPAWNDVRYAVGALYSLLEYGQVPSGLPTGAAPRTAVGQKADGTVVFYTIDGRQSGLSIGASLSQVGQRLAELGCVTALGLDGGGSTTLAVTRPDALTASTVNSPSDKSLRAVANHLFLVASNQPTGELDHFYVVPENQYVLAGSRAKVSVTGVDTNYIPMDSQYDLEADNGGGIEEGEDGAPVLLTPDKAADVTVTASRDRAEGEAIVHVVEAPDSITLKNGSTTVTSLALSPGGSVSLTVQAVYRHLPLKADNSAFTWAMDGQAAAVDETGVVTATAPGTATLTVSAGGRSATIPVTVSQQALSQVDGFEDGVPALSRDSVGAELTAAVGPDTAALGYGAAKLEYTTSGSTAFARFQTPYVLPAAYNQLNLWVYGDDSGNILNLLTDHNGETASVPVCTLDFTGWKQVSAVLPAGGLSVTGLAVEGKTPGRPSRGTLYLDQFTASFIGVMDSTAPVITASMDETGVVTAKIIDEIDGVPPLESLTVSLNGADVTESAAYTTDGALTYTPGFLPDEAHEGARVTITARDASGNVSRASVDVPPSGVPHKFTDIESYWAADYIDVLASAGVTNGYADGTFKPLQNISHQQFAAMLFRQMGLDGGAYADTVLPFDDAKQIDDYALPAVKTLYALGILTGTERDGGLYLDATAPLLRHEAAAMLGRSLGKGYAQAELTFSDAADIPETAAGYIRTLAALGIFGGYEDGSFKPNAQLTRGQMAKIFYLAF